MQTGIIAHGPNCTDLAHQVAAEIQNWDENFRNREVRFEIPTRTTDITNTEAGTFFLDRPHNPITTIWQDGAS